MNLYVINCNSDHLAKAGKNAIVSVIEFYSVKLHLQDSQLFNFCNRFCSVSNVVLLQH